MEGIVHQEIRLYLHCASGKLLWEVLRFLALNSWTMTDCIQNHSHMNNC